MYQILLLHEKLEEDCRVKDYLQLSGCYVLEGMIEQAVKYKEVLRESDMAVLYCENVSAYFGVCEKVRRLTSIPIIVMSACTDEWSKIRMLQMGADDYITEPILQGELSARVHAHIKQYLRLTRPIDFIQVRDFEIDGVSRCVKMSGKEVLLRAKEFDLLWYMVRNLNKTITKQELYSAVWKDEMCDGYYNCVSVHIKRIRQKIEKDPENPKYLETVWGVGYRFVG